MSPHFNNPFASNGASEIVKPALLIVDDDMDTCNLMCAFLSRDYNCDTAFDGNEALDRLKEKSYAVILADLMMPNIDGYGVLALAAEMAPATPVIVVTAVQGETSKAMQMGAFDYILKPFEPETVERIVERAVKRPGPAQRAPIPQ
jgi:DNA-binding NtrC family response regulator